jgi:hypothetical protein
VVDIGQRCHLGRHGGRRGRRKGAVDGPLKVVVVAQTRWLVFSRGVLWRGEEGRGGRSDLADGASIEEAVWGIAVAKGGEHVPVRGP